MVSCSLAPNFFSNFGVSTSKQCCSHFLAFSCRAIYPIYSISLRPSGRGYPANANLYKRLRSKASPLFFNPSVPFPSRLPSLCVRPATKDFQSLGTLVPRIMGLWEWFC